MDLWLPVGMGLFAVLLAVGVMLSIPLGLFNCFARVRPAAEITPVARDELFEALLGLNSEAQPWQIVPAAPGSRADLVAEWRLADARWWTVFQRNH